MIKHLNNIKIFIVGKLMLLCKILDATDSFNNPDIYLRSLDIKTCFQRICLELFFYKLVSLSYA